MHETTTSEGIIVKALPFRDYDCILTVFTPEQGLLKLVYKGAFRPKKNTNTTSPLSLVEIVYTKGKSDLYTGREISVTSSQLPLRSNLKVLEAACDMLHAIAATQQPEKAAPELYRLLLMYLHALPRTRSPQALARSFHLKLLRYEGIYPRFSHCCSCEAPLEEAFIYGNETFCSRHAPTSAFTLTKEDCVLMEHLAFSTDLSKLIETDITTQLSDKISRLFSESLAT